MTSHVVRLICPALSRYAPPLTTLPKTPHVVILTTDSLIDTVSVSRYHQRSYVSGVGAQTHKNTHHRRAGWVSCYMPIVLSKAHVPKIAPATIMAIQTPVTINSCSLGLILIILTCQDINNDNSNRKQ